MIELNLVSKAVSESRSSVKVVKTFKFFSLLLTFAFLAIIGYSAYQWYNNEVCKNNINDVKNKIFEKRLSYKIKDVENEWLANYYKVLAVKDIIKNATSTGLMFREIGLYTPASNQICRFNFTSSNKSIVENLTFDAKNTPELFVETLKEEFARSVYLGAETVLLKEPDPEKKDEEKIKVDIIDIGVRKVATFIITIPFVAEK